MYFFRKNSSSADKILFAFIALPIIIQFCYLYVYALNIPRYDDYEAILAFLNTFKVVPFSQKIPLLFIPHIEHRIFFTRALVAAYYCVFGDIDFRCIIFINFFILLLTFFSITHLIRKIVPNHWQYGCLALSLGLFDLINAENANFAMSGVSNYGVILFFTLSVLCYENSQRRYIFFAVFFQILCIYTSGNGHVGAFFIFLYTVLCRNRIKMVVSFLSTSLFSSIYFVHYSLPPGRASTDLDRIISWMLHAIGSHFSYEYGIFAGVILLAILLAVLPVSKKLVIDNKAVPLVILTLFILASQGLMSVFRGNLDVVYAYSSRYLIYSHMLTAITFTFLLSKIEHNDLKILTPVIIDGQKKDLPLLNIVLILLVCSYLKNFNDGKNQLVFMNHVLSESAFFAPDSARAQILTEEACKQGIYCINEHRTVK